MPLSTVFQSYRDDSSHYSCLSWFSPVLGWALKCLALKDTPTKNPKDPVRLEPRTPALRVKQFTTEPRGILDVTEKLKFVLARVENIVGIGQNAGYYYFLLFPQCFQKASFSGSLKVDIVW